MPDLVQCGACGEYFPYQQQPQGECAQLQALAANEIVDEVFSGSHALID